MANITIKEWVERFQLGEFDYVDREVQCDAGWYDWFCKDSSLKNKTQFLGKKLISLIPTNLFDIEKTYVFFKNNCPLDGNLYDSFSICNIENGDVLFWITPSNGHYGFHHHKPIVCDNINYPSQELRFSTWLGVKKYFHTGIIPIEKGVEVVES